MTGFKVWAAAVLLAAGASASAQIASQRGDGTGELFLVAFNNTNGNTLVFDTNVTLNNALSSGPVIFDGAVGSVWTSFSSTPGSVIGWSVYAGDLNNNLGASTSNPWQLLAATPGTGPITASQLPSGIAAIEVLLTNVNPSLSPTVNAAIFSPSGVLGFDGTSYPTLAASIDTFFANRAVAGTLLNPLGGTTHLSLNQVTSNFGPGGQGTFGDLLYQGTPYTATLSSTGQLTIAAVPEPETYALTLAGLLAIGAFARRRERQKSQTAWSASF